MFDLRLLRFVVVEIRKVEVCKGNEKYEDNWKIHVRLGNLIQYMIFVCSVAFSINLWGALLTSWALKSLLHSNDASCQLCWLWKVCFFKNNFYHAHCNRWTRWNKYRYNLVHNPIVCFYFSEPLPDIEIQDRRLLRDYNSHLRLFSGYPFICLAPRGARKTTAFTVPILQFAYFSLRKLVSLRYFFFSCVVL